MKQYKCLSANRQPHWYCLYSSKDGQYYCFLSVSCFEFCFYKLEPLTLIAAAPKQRNKKYYISIFCRIPSSVLKIDYSK